MAFKDNLYEVVKGAVSKEILDFCNFQFELQRKNMFYLNNVPDTRENAHWFNDDQVRNSFAQYASPCFETLSYFLLPRMEEVTGKSLYQTYTYARIYYKDAEMAIHTDRPSCEYSTTVCISNDEEFGPWDIWFRSLDGKQFPLWLEPGDALIYKGDILPHWRNSYKGNRQCQAFLHYVDKNGRYRDYKYDHRPQIGLPSTSRIG